MELNKAINERRSIRTFNKENITREEIIAILNSGIKAPSAKNRQPWHFYIIHENKELKNNIADELTTKMGDIALKTSSAIKESQALILIFGNIENELMDFQSIGACIENMCLKATDMNIGSLWIGFILNIEDYLKEKFETNEKLIAALAIGKTNESPNERPRKKLDEVSNWY